MGQNFDKVHLENLGCIFAEPRMDVVSCISDIPAVRMSIYRYGETSERGPHNKGHSLVCPMQNKEHL